MDAAALDAAVIDLYSDPDGKPTRGPLYKTRPNRGRGHREKGGTWTYVGGMLSSAGVDERSAHGAWAAAVEKLGYLVGRRWYEGVVSFYIWTPSVPAAMEAERERLRKVRATAGAVLPARPVAG